MNPDGHLDHVELYVSNLSQSAEFWGWLLARLDYEEYQSWAQGQSWRHPLSGTYLVIVQADERFLDPEYHRCRVGLNHLAFQVASPGHVDDLTNELKKRGATLLYADWHPHAGGPGTYAVFFEDPDRIKVEVVARMKREATR